MENVILKMMKNSREPSLDTILEEHVQGVWGKDSGSGMTEWRTGYLHVKSIFLQPKREKRVF